MTAINQTAQHFDIIGDVHGELQLLNQLLADLDYRQEQGVWQHPERQAIFVGDLIDKGPEAGQVLLQIKAMVEAGAAQAVVGNHELNLLRTVQDSLLDWQDEDFAYDLFDYLLDHHFDDYNTLADELVSQQEALAEALIWLKKQPLWIDEPDLRVVHACWDDKAIECLKKAKITSLNDAALNACISKGNPVYYAIDLIVAGCQHTPLDKPDRSGFITRRQRVRWWQNPVADYEFSEVPLQRDLAPPTSDAPVFFGHYGLQPKSELEPISEFQVCTDFGVAYGGTLVAYRHTVGQAIHPQHFVAVKR